MKDDSFAKKQDVSSSSTSYDECDFITEFIDTALNNDSDTSSPLIVIKNKDNTMETEDKSTNNVDTVLKLKIKQPRQCIVASGNTLCFNNDSTFMNNMQDMEEHLAISNESLKPEQILFTESEPKEVIEDNCVSSLLEKNTMLETKKEEDKSQYTVYTADDAKIDIQNDLCQNKNYCTENQCQIKIVNHSETPLDKNDNDTTGMLCLIRAAESRRTDEYPSNNRAPVDLRRHMNMVEIGTIKDILGFQATDIFGWIERQMPSGDFIGCWAKLIKGQFICYGCNPLSVKPCYLDAFEDPVNKGEFLPKELELDIAFSTLMLVHAEPPTSMRRIFCCGTTQFSTLALTDVQFRDIGCQDNEYFVEYMEDGKTGVFKLEGLDFGIKQNGQLHVFRAQSEELLFRWLLALSLRKE